MAALCLALSAEAAEVCLTIPAGKVAKINKAKDLYNEREREGLEPLSSKRWIRRLIRRAVATELSREKERVDAERLRDQEAAWRQAVQDAGDEAKRVWKEEEAGW